MEKVFIYWDNSNIFYEAQFLAEERESGPNASRRVRIDFDNILLLAHAGREVERARAAGSVPPELRKLWNRLEKKGTDVELFNRIEHGHSEQEVPDRFLQLRMLEDALDFNGDPGVAVLLTGDGAGYLEGAGFHRTLERMHKKGWRIEILSWENSCNLRMKQWAEQHGKFIALDDFYEAVTFLEPSRSGSTPAQGRNAAKLDLTKRPG